MIDPLIVNSIEYAGILSIMCVGLTATYQTTKVPNFAAADFAVVGMNAAYFGYAIFHLGSTYLAIPFSLLAGGAFGVIMYLLIMRPLVRKGSSIVTLMVATLAVDILFSGVEADIDYVGFATFHKAFAKVGIPYLLNPPQLPDFAALGQRGLLFTSPIALAVVVLGMYLLLTKSRFGIAMRAAIENPDLARTVGINVEQVYTVSWFIAGGLAGAAGALYTMWSGAAPSLGIQNVMILDIFAGSVLGGLTNIYGAVLGGTIVAVSENYLLGLMSSSLGSSALVLENGGISMIALIITLLVAHNGLVGVDWRRLYGRAVGRST